MIYALEVEPAPWAVNAFLISLGVALVLLVVVLIIQIIIDWKWF